VKKKGIGLSLLALALAALLALAPGIGRGAIGDANGPACRDITNGTFNYSQTSATTYNLNAQALLGADGQTAPCKSTTYTLYVIVDGSNPADATAYPQVGSAQWSGISVTDDDNAICVFATTATGRVFDTAPDSQCLQVTTTTGGGSGFN